MTKAASKLNTISLIILCLLIIWATSRESINQIKGPERDRQPTVCGAETVDTRPFLKLA